MAPAAVPSPGPTPPAPPGSRPRRDRSARERLRAVARGGAPVVLARDRILPVAGPLGGLLPGGGLVRGTVAVVGGAPGAGGTSVGLTLAGAATATGEWAAAVDPDGTLGGLAAAEIGVALERFAVVRGVPRDRWTTVVAALLDGVTVVLAVVPVGLRVGDARRLAARGRERGAVLVVLESVGALDRRVGRWPGEAALRLDAAGATWTGLRAGDGLLGGRDLAVVLGGRGAAARGGRAVLARAG